MILSISGQASILSILQQVSDEIPYSFSRINTSKDQLATSGIYDCAAFSAKIPDFGILLIHAYGARALEKLFKNIQQSHQISYPQIYYNLSYPLSILSYEGLLLELFGSKSATVQRHFVAPQDCIHISLR